MFRVCTSGFWWQFTRLFQLLKSSGSTLDTLEILKKRSVSLWWNMQCIFIIIGESYWRLTCDTYVEIPTCLEMHYLLLCCIIIHLKGLPWTFFMMINIAGGSGPRVGWQLALDTSAAAPTTELPAASARYTVSPHGLCSQLHLPLVCPSPPRVWLPCHQDHCCPSDSSLPHISCIE